MKKILLIISLAVFSFTANAQSLIPTKFGLKAGLNYSSLSITPIEGVHPTVNSSKIGVAAGFCVHIALSDKWFINPEVLYSQKGASFDYDFTHDYAINQRDEYATNNELTLSYVQLNPTISFKASDKLALNFGPSVAYLISEEYKYTQDPAQDITSTTITNGNLLTPGLVETNGLDVGLNVGLSYFLTENFFIDTRVNTGFMEVATATQPYEAIIPIIPSATYSMKSRTIVFSLAYLF